MEASLQTEIVLKASPLKWIGITVIGLTFGALGIIMLQSGESKAMSWLCIIFFGAIGAPIGVFQILRPGMLTMNAQGFEQKVMGRTLACDWNDTSEFGVLRIGRNKFVSFSRAQDEGRLMAGVSKTLTGGHSGMLGDNFGMKAHDLAELMNGYRTRALLRKQ